MWDFLFFSLLQLSPPFSCIHSQYKKQNTKRKKFRCAKKVYHFFYSSVPVPLDFRFLDFFSLVLSSVSFFRFLLSLVVVEGGSGSVEVVVESFDFLAFLASFFNRLASCSKIK